MNILIHKKIKSLLPQCRLGIIEAKVSNIETTKALQDELIEEVIALRKIELEVTKESMLPIIAESRQAYKICGKEPSRYRPSSEALLRRIRTGKALYRVSSIVDTINLLSISSAYSIGGFDSTMIKGDVYCDIGDQASYRAIGRGELNIEFMPGLRDDLGFFGTPTSDSERTMIKEGTENLLLVYYDFKGNVSLEKSLTEAQTFLEKLCKGEVKRNEIIT